MEQKEVNLDSLFESSNEHRITNDQQKVVSDYSHVDFGHILNEVSYKLPKGYPTVVDGVFTEREEVVIINEALEAEGLPTIILPEATVARPNTGSNDTSLKEGLVCLMFDCLKKPSIAKAITNIYPRLLDKKQVVDPKELTTLIKEIAAVYVSNKTNYGSGKSMPENLDKYVAYVLTTKQELSTLTNAVSAANAIRADISPVGEIIRNETFDSIRAKAVELVKEYGITLQADNWCPGDVYLVLNKSAVNKALKAKTLNIGDDSLNSVFKKDSDIVAISLKEEKAQAGKATTFKDTVFTNTFKADIKPDSKYGTSDNKSLAKLTANITRFEDYVGGQSKSGKRAQSYINAITSGGKVHQSVNNLLLAAGLPKIKSTAINPAADEQKFYKANKAIFDDVQKAIQTIKNKMNQGDSTAKIKKNFATSRAKFIQDLQKYKIEVTAEDSNKFSQAIQKENQDAVSVMTKKIAAYELASLIIERWADKNNTISPAYKKIQAMSNPFVALTAYAIAEAGVSPSFWKAVGKEKGLMGHADFFDANAVVDIDSKTSKIVLADSVKQSGFMLKYTTLLGTKRYATVLAFRFSGAEIRIEVQQLKQI